MPYEIADFAADAHAALKDGRSKEALEKVRQCLEKLLANPDFVAAHLGPDAKPGRETLHHDAELDFYLYAHIASGASIRPPHDHASAWAIYGQAAAHTQMTEWDYDEARQKPVPRRSYRLDPGMAGIFDVGELHSIDYPDGARFARVTGTDIDDLPIRLFKDVDVRKEIATHLG